MHLQVRNLKKKLQQIEGLRERPPATLDPQQRNKMSQETSLQAALDALENGASLLQVHIGHHICLNAVLA